MIKSNSENILKFEEAFRDKNGRLYLIMEYCDNYCLYNVIIYDLKRKRAYDLRHGSHYHERIIVDILKSIFMRLESLHCKN